MTKSDSLTDTVSGSRMRPSTSDASTDTTNSPSTPLGWLGLFLTFTLVYGLTANKGPQWQDSGEHIWRIVQGQLHNEYGLALSHPLHFYLGRLMCQVPFWTPAFGITMISVLGGAVAIANCFGCVTTLTSSKKAGLFAALSLAFAHTVWQHATKTETYTVGLALMSGEIWAMVLFATTRNARFALLLALLNGLGIANHMQASLTTPVILALAIYGVRHEMLCIRHVLVGTLLWLAGAMPYLWLVGAEWIDTGDFVGTVKSALFGKSFASAVLNVVPTGRNFAISGLFVLFNFPNLLLLMSIVGLRHAWRNEHNRFLHRSLVILLAIHATFVVRYNVIDQHTFFLPTYLMLCIFSGLGLHVDTGKGKSKAARVAVAMLVMTPIFYAAATPLARKLSVLREYDTAKPYRDTYTYMFAPWMVVDDSAERLCDEVFALASENTLIIVEDGMAQPALEYANWLEGESSANIIRQSDLGEDAKALLGGRFIDRHIILVPLLRDEPRIDPPKGDWQRVGDVYVYQPAP